MKLPMVRLVSSSIATAALVTLVTTTGCASYPAPVQRMADTEAAARSAEDNGAANDPQGQLNLKLAQEGIAHAKELLKNGENERADYALIRARSDAELALAEARERQQRAEAERAIQEVAQLQANGPNQPTSTTTTTSAVTASPSTPSAVPPGTPPSESPSTSPSSPYPTKDPIKDVKP